MDLAKLVSYSVNEEGTWFDYPAAAGSFKVKLSWVKTNKLNELGKKATQVVRNKETKFRSVPQYSDELFTELFAKEVIKEWKGLTLAVLQELLPGADISGIDAEIDCTDTNKVFLMKSSIEFSNWVTGHATEVEDHKKEQKAAELGN